MALASRHVPLQGNVVPAIRCHRCIQQFAIACDRQVEHVVKDILFIERHRVMVGEADVVTTKAVAQHQTQSKLSLVADGEVPHGAGRPRHILPAHFERITALGHRH